MKKISIIFISLLFILTACGSTEKTNNQGGTSNLSMATATSGSTGYMYGVALSKIVDTHLDNVKLTPMPSAGVIENDRLLREGNTDLIIHTAENAALSYLGKEPFDSAYELRALWPMYASFINIVVDENSPIKAIKDLKGKRIGIGAPGSSANKLMTKILEINGLNKGDYKAMPSSINDQVTAFKDGNIDAITIITGFNTSDFVDLSISRKVKWISIDEDTLAKLNESSPPGAYVPMTMPAGSYKNQEEDIQTVGAPLWIVTNKEFSEKLSEDIIKVFFNNLKEAQKTHSIVSQTNKELIESSIPPVPWHPGATKAFENLGYKITPFEE